MEMREGMKGKVLDGFALLFLPFSFSVTPSSRVTPQPLPLPLPTTYQVKFLVCGLCLFGLAFFLVVFYAEISRLLVSQEVFWSAGGFVGLGLYKGRKWKH